MPLQINDEHFGDRDYFDKRRKMLGELNKTATAAYLDYPETYADNHDFAVTAVERNRDKYPEQFADLQDQNTDAKILALNEIDFMDVDPRHAGNPVAQLGSKGANTRLRMPLAWADQHPDVGGGGRARGFYTPEMDQLVIPMRTMDNPGAGGVNTVTHETMHRGFSKMPNAPEDDPAHNYIYNKLITDYRDPNSFTPERVNASFESRPGFRYKPAHSQDAFNKKQAARFETMARQKLGS